MLPSFVLPPKTVAVPPPFRFRPLQGEARNVTFSRGAPSSHGQTDSQRSGLRYESKVHERLSLLLSDYVASPYFHFIDDSGHRTLIPDGVVHLPRPIIFEIKLTHTSDAWWQLRKLYLPLYERRFNHTPVLIEVCYHYDPRTPFPEETVLIDDPREFSRLDAIGVFRWKP